MLFHTWYKTCESETLQFFVSPLLCPRSSTASTAKAKVPPKRILTSQSVSNIYSRYRKHVHVSNEFQCSRILNWCNAVIWLADPLHTISRHGVQWLGVVHEMATFVLFCQILGGKLLMKMDNLIPEKTKRQASQTQDSRKRSNINDFYTYAYRVKRDCLKCAVLCYTLSQSGRRKIFLSRPEKGTNGLCFFALEEKSSSGFKLRRENGFAVQDFRNSSVQPWLRLWKATPNTSKECPPKRCKRPNGKQKPAKVGI